MEPGTFCTTKIGMTITIFKNAIFIPCAKG